MNRKSFVILLLLGFVCATLAHAEPWHDGQVKKVELSRARIVLRHGELTELDMPPMTMSYRVALPTQVERLQPGDEVEFQAAKVDGYYTVTALRPKSATKP